MSAPWPPPPPPRRRFGLRITLPLLVGVLLGYAFFRASSPGGAGGSRGGAGRAASAPSASSALAGSRPVEARGDLAADEKATIELFRRSSPAVVYITTLARRQVGLFDVAEVPAGTGTGFIWDRDGHVVTNFHVIQDASAAKVTLSDHSVWDGRWVGGSPDKDLAVLRISAPAEKLPPILVGESHSLQVGQKVFAIGNPFGLDQSLTTGIVSAVGRTIDAANGRRIEGVIQTDAAINPGNSGGPLLDSSGRLVGVNTAIASTTGSYAGIGFAVPVDIVNQVVPQLIQHGRIVRPQMGVVLLEDSLSRRLDLPGVAVRSVEAGSGAARAGLVGLRRAGDGTLVLGDVIVAVGDRKVTETEDLLQALETRKPGDVVRLKILREKKTLDVDVALSAPGR